MKKIMQKSVYVFFLLIPSVVFGAQFFFETPYQTIGVDKDTEVKVYVDTQGVAANAVEGSVNLAGASLGQLSVKDGNSLVNFWVDTPHVEGNKVLFSGITPGGFVGKIYLFSIVVHSVTEGSITVIADGIKLLKNDGSGSEINTTQTPLVLEVSHTKDNQNTTNDVIDKNPPEVFKPEVEKDLDLFEGKYFVVFATQDKGSGIASYEVKEGFFGSFVKATSPYVLSDQSLHKKIYVKAYDKSGNERVVVAAPRNPLPWYRDYVILGILLLVCICLYFLRNIIRKIISLFVR